MSKHHPIQIGQQFGTRTVVAGPERQKVGQARYPEIRWLLKCVCGKERWIRQTLLNNGHGLTGCFACSKKKHGIVFSIGHEIAGRIIIQGPEVRTRGLAWLLKCPFCGMTQWKTESRMVHGKDKGRCRHCSAVRYGAGTEQSRGCDGLRGVKRRYWRMLLAGAKDRAIEIKVSPEQAFALLEQQNWRCALSDQSISLVEGYSNFKQNTASLDRIDSSKSYELGNLQWVHKDVNHMKLALSQGEFIRVCTLITDYQRSKNI